MKRKSVFVTSLILLTSLIFTGCQSGAQTGSTGTEGKSQTSSSGKLNIGSVILNTTGEWFTEVINGMNQAAADLDVNLQIASADNDVSKEADQVDNFIAQGVDAICISPQNSAASIPAFERAVADGIPVVAWNTNVESEKSEYFVGVNNYELGAQTGEYFAKYVEEKMGGKAKVAILGIHKYEVGLDRVNGFLDQIDKVAGIEVVANQDAELKEEGMSVTENILQANPDVQVIWCWNQTSMEGAVAALKGLKRTDIVVMGTDMSVAIAKTMLEDNAFLAAVTTQKPYDIGYAAVENAVKLARGETVESQVLVPLETYTLDDKAAIEKYIEDRKDLVK